MNIPQATHTPSQPTQASSTEYHVASFIAYIEPLRETQIIHAIEPLAAVEVQPERDSGKLILLVEGESHGQIQSAVDQVSDIEGVIQLVAVYHQYDAQDQEQI